MDFLDFNNFSSTKNFPRENSQLEYKTSTWDLPKSLWETVSAFANTDGGLIILGIEEQRCSQGPNYKISGIVNPEQLQKELFNNNHNSKVISKPIIKNSDVRISTYQNKKLLQILIRPQEYNNKPILTKGKAFVRTDDGDRVATDDQLKYFYVEHQDQIDTRLLPNFDISDLNINDVQNYQNLLQENTNNNSLQSPSIEDFIKDIGVLRKSRTSHSSAYQLCEGGLLFFGNFISITDRFPRFQLDYIRYDSDSEANWIDRVSSGDMNFPNLNIFSFYNLVSAKLTNGIADKYTQNTNMNRGSYYSDLKLALKEALVNSLMHAYYDGEVAVKIIDRPSYVEFINPGDMRVSTESFLRGQTSLIRNPQIALLLRKVGIAEKAASGGPRILLASSKNNLLEPNVSIDHTLNTTTLRIWKVSASSYIESNYSLDEIQKFILEYAQVHRKFKFKDLMAATNNQFGSSSKVRKRLLQLLDQNLMTKLGKSRSTYYAIKQTEEQAQVGKIKLLKEFEKTILS